LKNVDNICVFQVEKDAQEMADREGVRIFQADIIYHLFDRWARHIQN
jgi:translation initiation factor IF-2